MYSTSMYIIAIYCKIVILLQNKRYYHIVLFLCYLFTNNYNPLTNSCHIVYRIKLSFIYQPANLQRATEHCKHSNLLFSHMSNNKYRILYYCKYVNNYLNKTDPTNGFVNWHTLILNIPPAFHSCIAGYFIICIISSTISSYVLLKYIEAISI